jgi:hypothetical protein
LPIAKQIAEALEAIGQKIHATAAEADRHR